MRKELKGAEVHSSWNKNVFSFWLLPFQIFETLDNETSDFRNWKLKMLFFTQHVVNPSEYFSDYATAECSH